MPSKWRHSCAIRGCKTKGNKVFRFPNPKKNWDRFNQWLLAAANSKFEGLTADQIYGRGYICASHFHRANFRADGADKLLQDAVPSLNLPPRQEIQPNVDVDLPTTPNQNMISTTINLEFSSPPTEISHTSGITIVTLTRKTSSGSDHTQQLVASGRPSRRQLMFSPLKSFFSENVEDAFSLSVQPLHATDTGLIDLPGTSSSPPTVGVTFVTPPAEHFEGLESPRRRVSPQLSTDFQKSDVNVMPSMEGMRTSTRSQKSQKENELSYPLLRRLGIKRATLLSDNEISLYKEAQRLQRKVARLKNEKRIARESIRAAKKLSQETQFINLTENLSKVQTRFFASQLRNAPRKPKGRSYTIEDKADAIAIWKNGPKAYKILSRIFALPSISSLRNILNSVPLQPGISEPIFEVLRRQVSRMKREKYKLCTLMFDEISIQPHLDYLPYEDRVIGFEDDGCTRTTNVADHATVFMLRGIYKRWKQPVAFAFCKSTMKAEKIVDFYKKIIKKAADVGLNVIASICDQGSTNCKAIDLLITETKRNAFSKGEVVSDDVIVIDEQTVIPLFDPPHLLKSVRNNFLKRDLIFIENGQKVAKWSHIEAAYDLDQSRDEGLRLLEKLSDFHVKPEKVKQRKMKVSLCAQVFSARVASFMDLVAGAQGDNFRGNVLPSEARDTALLIKFFDNIFDSVNGGFGDTKGKPLRGLVGCKTPHVQTWLKGKKMFADMHYKRNTNRDMARPKCLDGWVRTLDGFIMIKNRLQRLGYDSFPSRAFNQDPLENFFGQVRQYGVRNINPTCKSFVPYYKSLLIRTFSSYHSRGSNCEQDGEDMLITISDFLSQCQPKCPPPEKSLDKWIAPDIPSFPEVDFLEANALSYVGGFIVKHISPEKNNCEICLHNLEHLGEPDQLHHRIITLREYGENRKLKYMNVNVIKVLLQVHHAVKFLVPSALYCHYVTQRIISHLRCSYDLDFTECEHSEQMKKDIFENFIKIYLHGYMQTLSNLVFGRESTSSPNEIEKQLIDIYLKNRWRK